MNSLQKSTARCCAFVYLVLILVACNVLPATQNITPRPTPISVAPTAANEKANLEIFTCWNGGADLDALHALEQVYQKRNPTIQINDSLEGNTCGGTTEFLLVRLRNQEPPDTFNIHAGKESLDYIERGQLEPITKIFKQEGFDKVMPPLLLEQITIKGEIYTVPMNIHRSNMLWYNTKIFKDNQLTPPRTLDDFFAVAENLNAKHITPLAMGGGFELAHLFESVLLATYGPEDYVRLVHGDAALWSDARLLSAIHTFKRMLDYSNTDRNLQSAYEAGQMMLQNKAGMTIMGDWMDGQMKGDGAKPVQDFEWAAAPGTDGVFMWLSDSFGLTEGAPHRESTIEFLKTVGSKEGQDAFNPLKGSIPARIDADATLYDEYAQWSLEKFRTSKLVPSIVHGAAASTAFRSSFERAAIDFSNDGNEEAFAEALRGAAIELQQ